MAVVPRTRAVAGPWLGIALLVAGIVSGQLRAPQLLLALWLENLSIGVAAVVALAREPNRQVLVPRMMAQRAPDWFARHGGSSSGPAGPTAGRAGQVGSSSLPPPAGAPLPEPPLPVDPPPPTGAPLPAVPPPVPHTVDVRPRIPASTALLVLLVPLALFTMFQGTFLRTLASFPVLGQQSDGDGMGGPFATVLVLAAATARALRSVDADNALIDATRRVVMLHLGAIFGVAVLVFTVIGGVVMGDPRIPQIVGTLALVGLLLAVDRVGRDESQ